MLPNNANNKVAIPHDIARPTRMAAMTNAMKTIPWAMPKIFTPISVRGSARYLKYIPVNSPTHVTASANAINRKRPAAARTSNAVAMAPLCPHVPRRWRPIDRYAYPESLNAQFHTEDQMTLAD